jgi:D-beta-D-heptose 7-phosphate kinase/D-beta-D-heptose 1-phosphate adenosyltransferase
MTNKILVIGDIMVDAYVCGHTTRFSPEAPVPILALEKNFYTIGGAGNVARNLHALGADYELVAVVGNDGFRTVVDSLLKELHTSGFVLPHITNTVKYRVINGNQHVIRIDKDNKKALSVEEGNRYCRLVIEKLRTNQFSYLIIADYNKNLLEPYMIRWIMGEAIANGVKIVVDTKRTSISLFRGAYLITPNQAESIALGGIDNTLVANWLVTRGSEGMVLNTLEEEGVYHIPAFEVDNADVSGAGDTVTATVVSELTKGSTLYDACRVARIAASCAVMKFGTDVCTKEELDIAIKRGYNKIYLMQDLQDQIELWKETNSIVLLNGCFDILHEGHLKLLHEARQVAYPSKVVVALNSDESVSELKGYLRPISESRVQALAAMPFVDAVIEFDNEDELTDIIRITKPRYLIKGEDYKDKTITGREVLEANGGEVYFVPLTNNISSSKFLSNE